MDEQIRNADAKFDMEETSDELLDTWQKELMHVLEQSVLILVHIQLLL